MRAIDLFAGSGWAVACRYRGIEDIGAELMDEAVETRRLNGYVTPFRDVSAITVEQLIELILDMQIASPPCQTFSMAGKGAGREALENVLKLVERVGRGEDVRASLPDDVDPRTWLVLEPLRLLLGARTTYAVWEQVPPVLPVWEACKAVLEREGWSVWTGILNAEQYGVPQTRRRAFLIARRDGVTAAPPAPTHSRYYVRDPQRLDPGVLPWVSMAEALGWGMGQRPSFTVTGGGATTGGVEPFGRAVRDAMVVYRSSVQPNAILRSGDQPAPTVLFGNDANSVRWVQRSNYSGAGSRVTPSPPRGSRELSEPSSTVTSKGFAWAASTSSLRVTVAEAAALQTFPPDHRFAGSTSKQYLQIGNAVPPLLGAAVLSVFPTQKDDMTSDPFTDPGKATAPRRRDATPEDRAEVERDRYDRYMLPGPDGGEPFPHQRVTTFVKLLDTSSFALDHFEKRYTARGIATNPDLLTRAASMKPDENKSEWTKLMATALDRAGGNFRGIMGDAMHEITARIDKGENVDNVYVPEERKADVNAYMDLIQASGLRFLPELVERVIVHDMLELGGTFDRIAAWLNPATGQWELVVVDLKTGRDLEYGWDDIAVQLWVYATADALWDIETKTRLPMPENVRSDKAFVIRLPLDGTAELIKVDLYDARAANRAGAALTKRETDGLAKTCISTVHIIGAQTDAPAVLPQREPGAQLGERVETFMLPAQAEPVPDLVAELQASVDRSRAMRTTQQDADAELAAERLAKIGHQPPSETGLSMVEPTAGRELEGVVRTDAGKLVEDGQGNPLAPLAGDGQKGCSVCRRTGHRKGSPKCLGPADPASSTKRPSRAEMEASVAAAEARTAASKRVPDGWGQLGGDEPQECQGCAQGGYTKRADDVWVCANCGKPSRAIALLGQITDATSRAELLGIRQVAVERGTWNMDVHETVGMQRYAELPA